MSQPIYLVTGAHGFIGAWVVKRLLASNFKVIIFDKSPDPHRLRLIMDDEEIERTAFVAGGITDAEAVSRVVGEREITNVIHLAGLQVPTCRANPRLGAMVNVIGPINVFGAGRQLAFLDNRVKRVGLRPLPVYGVGRDTGVTSDPTKAMKAAVVGRPFHIRFGGKTDFLYVADCADAFIRAASADLEGSHVFNSHGESVEMTTVVEE